MWKRNGEKRPACKWRDHDWKLDHYAIWLHGAYKIYRCTVCGRLRAVKLCKP